MKTKLTQETLDKAQKAKEFGIGWGGEAPVKNKLGAPKTVPMRNDVQAQGTYPKRGSPVVHGAKVGAITKAINKFKK